MCAASLGSFESLESRVLFAAGDLDALFSGGKVIRDLAGGDDYGFAVAVQSDGKLLVAGRAQNSVSGNDFAVIRLNIDGTTDTTFGTGGKVLTDMGSSSDGAYAIAIQADGKIVVAGETMRMATSGDFAMARYNLNGSLDTTFGTGGKVVTDFSGSTDQALSLTLSGSKIVLAGWASVGGLPRFAVAQYTSAGALDSTFGTGGKVTTAYSPGYARAEAIARLSDGSFIVAGSSVDFTTGSTDFAAVHYSTTGAVDSAFGVSGWATVDMGGDEVAHAVIVRSDGKLVLAGEYYSNDTGAGDFALARLTTAGALDSTFGTSGTVLTDFGGDYDQGTSAVQQSDGKIVVAGLATVGGNTVFGLARYTSGGNLDTSFAGGKVHIQFGASDGANAVTLDSQGRIIVAGFTSTVSGATNFAVARLLNRINVAPVANPAGSYTVISGGSTMLDGTGSLDSDGTITNYEWDYNYDGVTFTADATGSKPSFSAAGIAGPATRTIALRVTDNDGATTIATTTITIRALIAPVANPGGGYSLNSGASIQLDGTGSTDVDGSIVLYQWDFNYDGSSFDVDASGSKPTYIAPGSLSASMTRTIALRVTDNDGLTSIATTTVNIHALINPIANPGGPYSLNSGASIQLDGSASSDSDGSIMLYEWDYNYNGTFAADATGANPTYHAPGGLPASTTQTIALRVTDNDGLTSIATTTISIHALINPVANPGGPYNLNSGASIQLNGASSLDSDGSIVSYEWDFNYDGVTFGADATGSNPTYTAPASLPASLTRTIALRVTDNDGLASIATTTISIHALINPLANPGGPYSLNSGASTQLNGSSSSDSDGSIVSYEWDFNYDGVNFGADATGSNPTYTAPASLSASTTRTIALRVTDNDGLTSIATTTVSIHALINPIARPGGPYSLNSGAPIQLNGSSSSDSDGSIVSYEWDFEYNGTFSADATGATPNFTAPGSLTTATTRTIALRVTDNDGLTSLATTTITISPVVTPPPPPPADGITLANDPANPGKKILILHGTAKSDFILFRSTRSGIEVQMNRKVLGQFANISRIVAYGEGGDDFIDACRADVPVELFGGAGNDILMGSRFNDILCGDDGNDNLFGGKGDDLIVGGTGSDRLHSHFGNDKLIGGVLTCENDLNQLVSLLNANKVDDKLITDDHAVDHLNGTPGADFIVLGAGDKLHKLH